VSDGFFVPGRSKRGGRLGEVGTGFEVPFPTAATVSGRMPGRKEEGETEPTGLRTSLSPQTRYPLSCMGRSPAHLTESGVGECGVLTTNGCSGLSS